MQKGRIDLNKVKRLIGIVFIVITFYLYVLALLNMFPLLLAAPLLFISILFTLSPSLKQNRFKGFR
jgi:hypothetical protein